MKQFRIIRGISSDLNGARFKAGSTVPVGTIEGAFLNCVIARWLENGVIVLEDKPATVKKAVKNGKSR